MIILPTTPAPADYSVSLVDYGSTLTPPLGGAEQRINRAGSKLELSVVMPPMRNKEEGRLFVVALMKAKSEGLRMSFPLGGIVPENNPGEPIVRSEGETGTLIRIGGFTPGYTYETGQPFSIIGPDGTSYLHYAALGKFATAAGISNIEIYPPAREIFPLGSPCNFHAPIIEGLVDGDPTSWNISVDHLLGIEFTVRERK